VHLNTNILKAAAKHIADLRADGFNVSISCVGRKAKDFLKRRNVDARNSWAGISGRISYANAQEIAADIIESYTNETVDEVVMIYNEFKSVIAQKVVETRLLPLAPIETTKRLCPYTTSSMSLQRRDLQQSHSEERRDTDLQGSTRVPGFRRGGENVCHGKCYKERQ